METLYCSLVVKENEGIILHAAYRTRAQLTHDQFNSRVVSVYSAGIDCT
jgi:hypothetical protein